MELTPVESRSITAAGYDEASQTLSVQFKSGAVYQYKDVPRETFDAFMAAESKGRFFQESVRPLGGVKLEEQAE